MDHRPNNQPPVTLPSSFPPSYTTPLDEHSAPRHHLSKRGTQCIPLSWYTEPSPRTFRRSISSWRPGTSSAAPVSSFLDFLKKRASSSTLLARITSSTAPVCLLLDGALYGSTGYTNQPLRPTASPFKVCCHVCKSHTPRVERRPLPRPPALLIRHPPLRLTSYATTPSQ